MFQVRVRDANEFDLNLVFDLGLDYEIVNDGCQPRFVKVQVSKDQSKNMMLFDQCRKHYLVEDSKKNVLFLSTSKMRQWLQSLVTKVLNNNPGLDIKTRNSGPAFTLMMKFESGSETVDIDLVPAFTFSIKDIRGRSKAFSQVSSMSRLHFQLIPKSPSGNLDMVKILFKTIETFLDYLELLQEWQLSFPDQEKDLLTGGNNIKSLIKLLKYFREVNPSFHGLSSYALKTVVLHMLKVLYYTTSLSFCALFK